MSYIVGDSVFDLWGPLWVLFVTFCIFWSKRTLSVQGLGGIIGRAMISH